MLLEPRLEPLIELAQTQPVDAVFEGYRLIEDALRYLLSTIAEPSVLAGRSAPQLAAMAANEGLILPTSVNAVQGIAVLRNMVARGKSEEVDAIRALDYLSLVDGILHALKQRPRN